MTVEEMWKTFVQDRQAKRAVIARMLEFLKGQSPKWVQTGRKSQAACDADIAIVAAILDDYSGMVIRDESKDKK